MNQDEARVETPRNRPVVFVGVGHCAIETLAELPQVAQDLRIRIAGPFGIVTLNQPDGEIFISDYQWLSDIEVSRSTVGNSQVNHFGAADVALTRSFNSLIRQLRAQSSNMILGRSPRVRVCSYIVIDLSVPGIVTSAVRLAKLLRQVDPSLDITGLALTGRTAESQIDPADSWFDTVKQLLEQVTNLNLLQRLYILDGCDTNNTWLQTLRQMQRVGAEFLLHHGLSPYRTHLQRTERSRASSKGSFLDYCGSIACRTFNCDRSAVARAMAAELAEDLADLEQGVLTEERSNTLDGLGRRLASDIISIYQEEHQFNAEAMSPAVMNSTQKQNGNHDMKIVDTIKETLKEVCAKQPVLSLRWFLSAFRPRLMELTIGCRLLGRVRSRQRVAQALRRQDKDTYIPTRIWSRLPRAKWRARFEPYLDKAPSAVVSCPVRKEYYCLGIIVLAVGLAMVGIAGWTQAMALTMCGGIVAIWASALTVLPIKWAKYERTMVSDENEIPKSAPYHPYRQSIPSVNLWAGLVVLALGIIVVAGTIFVPTGNSSLTFRLGLVAFYASLLALAGFVLIYEAQIKIRWPMGVAREQETPGLAVPPNWRWHIAGLLCLTLAWAIICIWAPQPAMNNIAVGVPGLILILVGAALVRLPKVGHAQLIYRIPKKPKPLVPEVAPPTYESELVEQVERINPWVETLLATPDPIMFDYLEWPVYKSDESILEAFVNQWQKRLADIFRRTLQSRPEKSLKEMARNPQNWADCLAAELSNPTVGLANPGYLFALHEVRRWLDGMTWQQLIAELNPDPQWFDFFLTRSVPPRWPPTRNDPEIDTSVITVGKALWKIVAPLADPNSTHRLKMVDWQDPHTLVAVRIVQGLGNGWRGYPGLPGQTRNKFKKEEK